MDTFEQVVREGVADMIVDDCKGLFWRASESQFLSSHKSIESKKSLRFLKRMSCPGCDHCNWMWDHIKEDTLETSNLLDNIVSGKLYEFYIDTYYDHDAGGYECDGSGFKEVI